MRKVLVVEDDRFISAIFTMFLKAIGHELVGRCQSGREALEMCRVHQPEVVLMDIHLEGDWDGIQTADRITREFHIPVVFISSDTDSDIINRAIVSNSYGYLVKPIDKKELAISIDLAYYKHQADQELKQREKGFRQFISDSPLPICIVTNGLVQYINNNALSLFRSHYIEDMIGMPFLGFVESKVPDWLETMITQCGNTPGKMPPFRARMKDVHNNGFYAEVLISCVEFNRKKSLQVILRNISRELKMELRLEAMERLAGLGKQRFFLMGNDLVLLDYSSSIASLKSLHESNGVALCLKPSLLKVQDASGADQLGRLLSGIGSFDAMEALVSIAGQLEGHFSIRAIPSAVDGYYGLLFVCKG